VAGWFGGLFWDPVKWHCAQTGAFAGSVFVWVNVVPAEARHGAGACGVFAWQVKQVIPPRTVRKSAPWQIWQEANPELPGALLAAAPWTAGVLQFGIGPW